MVGRRWTKETALQFVREKGGLFVNDTIEIEPREGHTGNTTLGALDYLRKEHRILTVFKAGRA